MHFRLLLGSLVRKVGYTISRNDRFPDSNIDFIALAFNLIKHRMSSSLSIVQIGAFDGLAADSLVHLLKSGADYRALLVEPQPNAFAMLVLKYGSQPKVTLANVAIAEKTGTIEMHVPTAHAGASPFASMDPIRIRQMRDEGLSLTAVKVASSTVKDLAKQHSLEAIDLLVIDTEGHDFVILKQFLAAGMRPKAVQLESRHLSPNQRTELRELLTKQDYVTIDSFYDTLALCKTLLSY